MFLQESNVEKLALKIHLSKTTNMCRAWFGLPQPWFHFKEGDDEDIVGLLQVVRRSLKEQEVADRLCREGKGGKEGN